MFGRKGVAKAEPQAQSPEDMDAGVDNAIAMLSQALGINLNFQVGSIFSPALWQDPVIGPLLSRSGLEANMRGNKISLLIDPVSVSTIAARSPEDPLRQSLENAGFGMVLYNGMASNGFNDGLTDMQRGELQKIAASPASDEAKKYAVFNLHMFSGDVMKGKIKLG